MGRSTTAALGILSLGLLAVLVMAAGTSGFLSEIRRTVGPRVFDPVLGIALAISVLLTGFSAEAPRLGESKEIALVAMVVALGSAGRILFAAAPNVSPVDWLTLSMGLVFGPLTGFTVGAATMLVSNFWLGHGPWTIYQMVGMGALGVLGGILSRFRFILGRRALAMIGFLWGFTYGTITSLFWVLIVGSVVSWGSFAAIWITGIPFYFLQGIGNAVFLFVLGPRTLRILDRFRDRFRVKVIRNEAESVEA